MNFFKEKKGYFKKQLNAWELENRGNSNSVLQEIYTEIVTIQNNKSFKYAYILRKYTKQRFRYLAS